jgi:hypothetical protein
LTNKFSKLETHEFPLLIPKGICDLPHAHAQHVFALAGLMGGNIALFLLFSYAVAIKSLPA